MTSANGRQADEEYLAELEVVADEMQQAMTGLGRAITRLQAAVDRARQLKANHASSS